MQNETRSVYPLPLPFLDRLAKHQEKEKKKKEEEDILEVFSKV